MFRLASSGLKPLATCRRVFNRLPLPPRRSALSTRAAFSRPNRALPRQLLAATSLVFLGTAGYNTYDRFHDRFQHSVTAVIRSGRAFLIGAMIAADYKWSLRERGLSEEEKMKVRSKVHKRSAERVRDGLRTNGGVYIKIVSSQIL